MANDEMYDEMYDKMFLFLYSFDFTLENKPSCINL